MDSALQFRRILPIPRNGSYSTVDGRWFAHF